MNWLMNMFSEFSETVMGESEAFERDRKSQRKKCRAPYSGPSRKSRPKKYRGDRISEWDW